MNSTGWFWILLISNDRVLKRGTHLQSTLGTTRILQGLCHTKAKAMREYLKSTWESLDREAWQRFFMAVAGLGLAFAAAVFSSVARERGNPLATAIFAITALSLALVVGLLTVPFLARRVAAARMKDAFDYELTREGMVYMGVLVIIGIAALNTANNLLWIVVAAMLAAIGVSGIASAADLRRLELDVIVPKNAFAKGRYNCA